MLLIAMDSDKGEPVAIGVAAINAGAYASPDVLSEVAQQAEANGLDSLWVIEHVVMPRPRMQGAPLDPDHPILDPVVALAFVAARTRSILLATGIVVLPHRNPLILAKEIASLDVLSRGRVIFGFGVGYFEPEFKALRTPFSHRGTQADSYLEAMKAIWTDSTSAAAGFTVSEIGTRPRPVQQPYPPIVVGGRTPAAFRRAALVAKGWYGYGLDVAEAQRAIDGLRLAEEMYGRPPELGRIEVTITVPGNIDAETAQKYAALGVNRINLLPPAQPDPANIRLFVEHGNLLRSRVVRSGLGAGD